MKRGSVAITWGIARYEMKMQLRSLVFWLGVALVVAMLWSEVIAGMAGAVDYIETSRANPGLIVPGNEAARLLFEQYETVGYPSAEAALIWSDRMGIVLAFVGLFIAGFVLERDRLSRSREVVGGRPVGAFEYAVGKYVGVALPLGGVAVLTWAAAVVTNMWAQGAMGFGFDLGAFLPALALLAPVVIFVPALVLAATALVRRPAVVIPLFLVYLFAAGVIQTGRTPGEVGLWQLLVRTDNWADFAGKALSGMVGANRLLLVVAAAALVAVAGWAWERGRRAMA